MKDISSVRKVTKYFSASVNSVTKPELRLTRFKTVAWTNKQDTEVWSELKQYASAAGYNPY